MSKVIAIMSMSLDGYVADKQDGVAEVFDWYSSGEVEIQAGGAEAMTFHLSSPVLNITKVLFMNLALYSPVDGLLRLPMDGVEIMGGDQPSY